MGGPRTHSRCLSAVYIYICLATASGCTFEERTVDGLSRDARPIGSDGRTELRDSAPADGATSVLYLLSDPVVEERTDDVKIRFSVSDFCQANVSYGVSPNLDMFTTRETSFDYATHGQSVRGLISGTRYDYRILATDREGNSLVSEIFSFIKE